MYSLRDRVLKLAAEKPVLGAYLLPLVTASQPVYVATKELPDTIKKALKSVGFARRDISVAPASTVRIQDFGGDGMRSFVIVLNLETGKYETHLGSWGGPNMFTQRRVDVDDASYDVPVNGAVIKGSQGSTTFASLYVHPSNLANLISTPTELTAAENNALAIIVGLTSGARAEAFERRGLGVYGPRNPIIQSLVEKDLVKVTSSGITRTTKGRNVVDRNIHV